MRTPTTAKNPDEQLKLERKRFQTRQRSKPVLAEKIRHREERKHKKDGSERINLEELN